MKIQIQKQALLAGIQIPVQVTGKSDKDFTQHLKFETHDNTVKVSSTNNGLEANLYCVAEHIEDAEPFCVNAKKVHALVSSYGNDKPIEITKGKDGKHLVFKHGRSKHKVDLLSLEQFPDSMKMKGDQKDFANVKVGYGTLRDSLNSVAWSAVKNTNSLPSTRMFLANIHLKLNDNGAELFCSDGIKCCQNAFGATVSANGNPDVLIPKRVTELLNQFASYIDDEDVIDLSYNHNMMRVVIPMVGILTSTVCTQRFPDLTSKTNRPDVANVQIDSAELKSAIKRFGAGEQDPQRVGIEMCIDEKQVTLSNPKTGSVEILDSSAANLADSGEVEGANKFCFQLKLLGEVTSNIAGQKISIGINDERWAHVSSVTATDNRAYLLEYKL